MSAAQNNDEAAAPNRDLIASLLPTIKPPAALALPDAYSKQSTARLVLNKLFSLCMLVGVLGSVYSFGRLTTGVNAISTIGFSSHKLDQWAYGEYFFKTSVNTAVTEAGR